MEKQVKSPGHLQLLRLHRLGRSLDLSEKGQQIIQRSLEAWLHRRPSPDKPHPVREETLEKLVAQGASYQDIANQAWVNWQRQPSLANVARIIEMAFLHGATQDLLESFHRVKQIESTRGFYQYIQANLREYLVTRLWIEGKDGVLSPFIDASQSWLTNMEHLYAFHRLVESSCAVEASIHFKDHEQQILTAIAVYGAKLGLSKGDLYLNAAELALSLDDSHEAARYIDMIPQNDQAFARAMELYLRIPCDKDSKGYSKFDSQLIKESHWPERIRLFYQFFAELRGDRRLNNPNRPGLNQLVKDPLRWLPKEPEAWAAMSQMLYNNRDLLDFIPQLFRVYQDHTLDFQSPSLDLALWTPLLHCDGCRDELNGYWQAVARFHSFLQADQPKELWLWDAFNQFEQMQTGSPRDTKVAWHDLHRAGTKYVSRTPAFLEAKRRQLLGKLAMATSDSNLLATDVISYLNHSDHPPYQVLQALHQKIKRGGQDQLELKIIQKKAELTHYCNNDLDRLWQLSLRWKHYDLSWRICSVLMTRQSLNQRIHHAWSISGAKRDQFATMPISENLLIGVFKDLPKPEARLVEALIRIGPHIPELMALLDKKVQSKKLPAPTPESLDSAADQLIELIRILPPQRKRYIFDVDSNLNEGTRIPPFINMVPQNIWAQTAIKLLERLGCFSWGFSLQRLANAVEGILPRPHSQLRDHYTHKIGKWLRSLTPEARTAWYDLPKLIRPFDDNRGIELQVLIAIRLALVLDQNPFYALQSLIMMRVPVTILWQTETWLLSDSYTELRKHLGSPPRVPVPETLRKLSVCPLTLT